MIIDGVRALAYIQKIAWIKPIQGADNIELIGVLGWTLIAKKGEFKEKDFCVFFEIDSKLPEAEWSEFMRAKHFKVKTYNLKKFGVVSQGLALPVSAFKGIIPPNVAVGDDMTKLLGVTYAVEEDNKRKAPVVDSLKTKYNKAMAQHPKFAKTKFARWCGKRDWAKRIITCLLLNKKKENSKKFPVGKFKGVKITDQERIENIPFILTDKSPFIVTEKCDGSSATYILERKGRKKFEFYVCSRRVRMLDESQECFHGSHNYYWEVAKKYDIENKMRAWLDLHKEATFICWQGEICAPAIQGNPHRLSETHFYCFHWTDSINGRRPIILAQEDWKSYAMEVVPIIDIDYTLPDSLEEMKASAEGVYSPSVCEGKQDCPREGLVYYKVGEPTCSFKNVSKSYLLKHNG